MKRYGEEYIVTDDEMLNIASYMMDEYREYLHNKIAPCTNEEFIYEYCKIVPDFEDLLFTEFGIEL